MKYFENLEYYLISIVLLLLTAGGKTLDKLRKKEIEGKLGVISSLIFSILGGVIAGMIANVYIETIQIQWVCIAGGSWMGERILEVVGDSIEDKINMIFKNDKDEK